MPRSSRILFTFDQGTKKLLEELEQAGGYSSWAAAVRSAVVVTAKVQELRNLGFSELVARNPVSKDERIIVVAR